MEELGMVLPVKAAHPNGYVQNGSALAEQTDVQNDSASAMLG